MVEGAGSKLDFKSIPWSAVITIIVLSASGVSMWSLATAKIEANAIEIDDHGSSLDDVERDILELRMQILGDLASINTEVRLLNQKLTQMGGR